MQAKGPKIFISLIRSLKTINRAKINKRQLTKGEKFKQSNPENSQESKLKLLERGVAQRFKNAFGNLYVSLDILS